MADHDIDLGDESHEDECALVVDPRSGLIVDVSALFCAQSGYSVAELIGQPWSMLSPSSSSSSFAQTLVAMQAARKLAWLKAVPKTLSISPFQGVHIGISGLITNTVAAPCTNGPFNLALQV